VRFTYRTRWGTFQIVQQQDGRWAAMFEDENLGSYHNAIAAHDDLIGDHCFSNSAGLDTSQIGLPEVLADWEQRR
jgi:hypothetical protein